DEPAFIERTHLVAAVAAGQHRHVCDVWRVGHRRHGGVEAALHKLSAHMGVEDRTRFLVHVKPPQDLGQTRPIPSAAEDSPAPQKTPTRRMSMAIHTGVPGTRTACVRPSTRNNAPPTSTSYSTLLPWNARPAIRPEMALRSSAGANALRVRSSG